MGKARKHTVTLSFTLLHEPDYDVEAAASEVTRAVAAAPETALARIVHDAMQSQRTVFEGRSPAGRWKVETAGPATVDGKELAVLQAKLAKKH